MLFSTVLYFCNAPFCAILHSPVGCHIALYFNAPLLTKLHNTVLFHSITYLPRPQCTILSSRFCTSQCCTTSRVFPRHYFSYRSSHLPTGILLSSPLLLQVNIILTPIIILFLPQGIAPTLSSRWDAIPSAPKERDMVSLK